MGAADGEADERPVHRVHARRIFHRPLSRHQRRVREVCPRHRPSRAGDSRAAADRRRGRDACSRNSPRRTSGSDGEPPHGHGSHPVVLVRFDDAVAYCAWLSDIARAVRADCRRKPSGKGRARRRGRHAISVGRRASILRACNYLQRSVGEEPARHAPDRHVSAERVRPVRHASATSGSGCPTGTAPTPTASGDTDNPAGPPSGTLARSSAAGRGSTDDVDDAAMRVSPQGAARHLRVQHRIPHRLRRDRLTPADYERARRLLMRRDPVLGAAIKTSARAGWPSGSARIISPPSSARSSASSCPRRRRRRSSAASSRSFPTARSRPGHPRARRRGAARRRLQRTEGRYLRDLCARIADGRLQLEEIEALDDER